MTPTTTIGVNCDMGESFGIYTLGRDTELMAYITAANVACGFHAGDPSVMAETIAAAKDHGVVVGAHPSLPDRQGFGRREMKLRPDELNSLLTYQVGALSGFLDAADMELHHLKVHGALYGMTARQPDLALTVCTVAAAYDVPVYGMAGTMHEECAQRSGVGFVSEYFADLEYADDGTLIISRTHDAVEPELAAERARRAIREGVVESVGGVDVAVRADTVCLHSDTPNAVEIAEAVSRVVAEENARRQPTSQGGHQQ